MTNTTFDTIEKVANDIQSKLNSSSAKKKIVLLYAFNGTGKTRLSTLMQNDSNSDDESEVSKILSYNAFFEDLFTWENDEYILEFNPNNYIIKFIIDQGLDNQITDNFQKLTRSKILPYYDWQSGQISFSFSPGDERSEDNVKISRGEESLFVWSVFFTVLEAAILALNSEEDDRETDLFNNLEYIIIDDPVSSIDDTRIISMAIELIKMIDSSENNNLKFLVTTHHALFFNVLCNEYKRKQGFNSFSLLLSKNITGYKLENQGDTPFAYHLVIKDEIQKAIDDQSLQKYHFNLFRGLLEKTANFLGYRSCYECLEGDDKKEIMRLVNLYSHGRLSDLESANFPDEHKDLFVEAFSSFVKNFKWNPSGIVSTETTKKV
jgi:wobble nucleotide-excising tRNase